MSVFAEKRYCIDPGIGKKMDGCPYSIYEDGHDVQEYIVPPKGYKFTGFKFDPYIGNQIYDGKLIAQYEKEPFEARLKTNLWKIILVAGIVLVVVLITLLVVSVFSDPKPKSHEKPSGKQKTEVVADTTEKQKDNKEPAAKGTPAVVNQNEAKQAEENTVNTESNTATEKPFNNEQNVQSQETQTIEEPKPKADDPEVMFKNEFWAMIHERNSSMDAYTELYNNYKSKIKKGEEFDYLRFTILKNYVSFKAWYEKLKAIPESQLSSIKSINELSKHLKE